MDGTANENLWLLDKGIPLEGVTHQGELTSFQRLSLILAEQEQQPDEEPGAEQNRPAMRPNGAGMPGGGGTRTERRSYTNLSLKTGKSPEQLIEEHKATHGT